MASCPADSQHLCFDCPAGVCVVLEREEVQAHSKSEYKRLQSLGVLEGGYKIVKTVEPTLDDLVAHELNDAKGG